MRIFSAFNYDEKHPSNPGFDNSNRIFRILYRLKTYFLLFIRASKKGISIKKLFIPHFPYLFRDAQQPPIVALEFTTHCNLRCLYCTNALNQREKGHMSEAVFQKIIRDLSVLKPCRVQLVGNGEATLHPDFGEFLRALTATRHFISLVTNGQWRREGIAEQILQAGPDVVEISVDAGGKEVYETSRINGSFELLLKNLATLKARRDQLKSNTLINIRLMIRPSQAQSFHTEKAFWKPYADTVMTQVLTKINNTTYGEDLFIPAYQMKDEYPKCSMPFKHIEVRYTGEVLLCYYSFYQAGAPGLVLGNIRQTSILELWNSSIMKAYRNAHRHRITGDMPVCRGCAGT